jgi:hypothetical protein
MGWTALGCLNISVQYLQSPSYQKPSLWRVLARLENQSESYPDMVLDQRLCTHRPAALSAICLSWLGRIWNVGEGGSFCTKQASQHSIFCTASDRSTESTVLAGLLCTQWTTFTQISIFPRHFLSRSLFSLFLTKRISHNVLKNILLNKLAISRNKRG